MVGIDGPEWWVSQNAWYRWAREVGRYQTAIVLGSIGYCLLLQDHQKHI